MDKPILVRQMEFGLLFLDAALNMLKLSLKRTLDKLRKCDIAWRLSIVMLRLINISSSGSYQQKKAEPHPEM